MNNTLNKSLFINSMHAFSSYKFLKSREIFFDFFIFLFYFIFFFIFFLFFFFFFFFWGGGGAIFGQRHHWRR